MRLLVNVSASGLEHEEQNHFLHVKETFFVKSQHSHQNVANQRSHVEHFIQSFMDWIARSLMRLDQLGQ